jgi:hypothetical protein
VATETIDADTIEEFRGGTVFCYIPSADICGCLHFFDEMFGGIMGIAYLCSVNGKSITLIVTLNYEDYGNNSELQEM